MEEDGGVKEVRRLLFCRIVYALKTTCTFIVFQVEGKLRILSSVRGQKPKSGGIAKTL